MPANKEKIKEQIVNYLNNDFGLSYSVSDFSDDKTFRELGIDSLGAVSTAINLEAQFGISVISRETLFGNIGDLISYISAEIGEREKTKSL